MAVDSKRKYILWNEKIVQLFIGLSLKADERSEF